MLNRLIVITVLFFVVLMNIVQSDDQFKLISNEVHEGVALNLDQVANGFGCKGNNISPSLIWVNPPAKTLSYAVTLYDPDAPTGSGWWHWVMFNIPATITSLPKGSADKNAVLPQGVIQSRNDTGNTGYFGACPPEGDKRHRYQLTVYALDVESLPLNAESTAAMVGFYIHAHSLASASIEAKYQR